MEEMVIKSYTCKTNQMLVQVQHTLNLMRKWKFVFLGLDKGLFLIMIPKGRGEAKTPTNSVVVLLLSLLTFY